MVVYYCCRKYYFVDDGFMHARVQTFSTTVLWHRGVLLWSMDKTKVFAHSSGPSILLPPLPHPGCTPWTWGGAKHLAKVAPLPVLHLEEKAFARKST